MFGLAKKIPRLRKSTLLRWIVYNSLLIFLLFAIVGPVYLIYNNESREKDPLVSPDKMPELPAYIDITSRITSLDPVTGIFRMTFDFQLVSLQEGGSDLFESKPNGAKYLNKDITLFINGVKRTYNKRDKLSPVDVSSSFTAGTVRSYPFDTFTGEFSIDAYSTNNESIPLRVSLDSRVLGGWMLSLPGPPFVEPGTLAYHEFEFDLKRSQLTQFFAIFVVILNWLLSLIMGFFAVQVLLKNRKVEPGALVPPCALLFALPSLRNVQPSAPPVGATTDILGFFWNMAIVAVSAMVVILSFILRWKAENPPTESPHMHPQNHRNSSSTSYNPKRLSGTSFNALQTPPLHPTNFDSENTLPSDFVAPRSVSLTVQSEDSIHRGRSGSRHPPVMSLFDGGNNRNQEDLGGLHESPERIALQPQHPHRHFRVI